MRNPAVLALAVSLAVAACTPIPSRFTELRKRTNPRQEICGYEITRETSAGFDLEVLWKNVSPNPDPAIRAARLCYQRAAAAIAETRGRTIEPIGVPDMGTSMSYDNAGRHVVYVTGKVVFVK